jgi:hypothetical protein
MMRKTELLKFAVPAAGREPTFDDMAAMALTVAAFDLPVGILCFNQDCHSCWQAYTSHVDVFNSDEDTLEAWVRLLRSGAYYLIILAGVRQAVRDGTLSAAYFQPLVTAAPHGMVLVV